MDLARFLSAYFGSGWVFVQLVLDLAAFFSAYLGSRTVLFSLFRISQSFCQLVLDLAKFVSAHFGSHKVLFYLFGGPRGVVLTDFGSRRVVHGKQF